VSIPHQCQQVPLHTETCNLTWLALAEWLKLLDVANVETLLDDVEGDQRANLFWKNKGNSPSWAAASLDRNFSAHVNPVPSP